MIRTADPILNVAGIGIENDQTWTCSGSIYIKRTLIWFINNGGDWRKPKEYYVQIDRNRKLWESSGVVSWAGWSFIIHGGQNVLLVWAQNGNQTQNGQEDGCKRVVSKILNCVLAGFILGYKSCVPVDFFSYTNFVL